MHGMCRNMQTLVTNLKRKLQELISIFAWIVSVSLYQLSVCNSICIFLPHIAVLLLAARL